MKKILLNTALFLFFSSAIAQKKAQVPDALAKFLSDTALRGAHAGVSVLDASTGKFIYEHQPDKYFVPASNIKIVTTYAALKNLKDILTGIRYYENDTAVYLVPTGDPTLLHRSFTRQPVLDFLKLQQKKIYISQENWKDKELGKGWSWDDFSDEYMTERNALPVYGNTIRWVQEKILNSAASVDESISVYSDPEVDWKVGFEPNPLKPEFAVKRDRLSNVFTITEGTEAHEEILVPFITNGINTSLELLYDTVHKNINVTSGFLVTNPQKKSVLSQPLDSVLRPMLYNSDNFFAEQLLLMAGEERTGILDAESFIDTLLFSDLQWLPQKPVWVDGSGLSRYNLFTPRDFVAILDSMQREFGMQRMKILFPTGDSGTLKGYFLKAPGGGNSPVVFAKTGSMSGVMALSGFLYTRNKRLLIFSVLVNNVSGKVTPVKRAIERFLNNLN